MRSGGSSAFDSSDKCPHRPSDVLRSVSWKAYPWGVEVSAMAETSVDSAWTNGRQCPVVELAQLAVDPGIVEVAWCIHRGQMRPVAMSRTPPRGSVRPRVRGQRPGRQGMPQI